MKLVCFRGVVRRKRNVTTRYRVIWSSFYVVGVNNPLPAKGLTLGQQRDVVIKLICSARRNGGTQSIVVEPVLSSRSVVYVDVTSIYIPYVVYLGVKLIQNEERPSV